jgi:hypothetical protein
VSVNDNPKPSDRWEAARLLMAGKITAQEYREREPSYKADYLTAFRELSRRQRKANNEQ